MNYSYRRTTQNLIEQDELRRRWQQLAVIFGVIVISALLAVVLPSAYHIAVIGLPFALIGLFVILKWPPLALVLLVAASLTKYIFVPLFDVTAAALLGLTVLWFFRMLVYEKEIKIVAAPAMTAVLVFAIVVLLSFGVGQFPWFPVQGAPMETQLGGLFIFLASFAAFVLAAQQVRDIRWLKWMIFLFLAFAALFTFLAIVPGGRRFIRSIFSVRATGGSLFWVWTVSTAVSQALFNEKLKLPWRVALGAVGAGLLFVGVVMERAWVSGWLPPLAALVTIIWIGKPKLALPMSLIALVGVATQWGTINDMLFTENEYSTISRLDAWRIMFEIIEVNPILGVGPSNYYFYTPLYNILGFFVQFNSHNNYVDLLAQTGLAGFICFFWVAWAVASLGMRLLLQVPKGSFAQAYVLGCLGALTGALVAGMLGDWVIPFYYNIGINGLRASALVWMGWGGLVAIEKMIQMGKPVD